jgi:acetyl esterase/lipase
MALQCEQHAGIASQTIDLDLSWALQEQYVIYPGITYITANNYQSKLDVYQHRGPELRPTLIYIHGGGWMPGKPKEYFAFWFMPYLQLGWNVVNVEYRTADISLAPAAVEDCLCALRWVARNAKQYNFDLAQLVVSGHSAGGHLALMVGMVPASAGLDRCPEVDPTNAELPKVAAIVDWFGPADIADIAAISDLNVVAKWLGSQPDLAAVAKRVSPLTYVRAGLPPTIAIHGEKDPLIPYQQSVRLRDALTHAGVPNELIAISNGGHGFFTLEETKAAYLAIFDFLTKNGVNINPTP